jgi:hypothetical protein
MSNDFIEQKILGAIRKLLTGKANELLREMEFAIPIIEIGGYGCGHAAVPLISLAICEQTEKERIIRTDVYSLTIHFELSDTPESETECYAYGDAIGKALRADSTLGGVVDKAVITGKKYLPPHKFGCGDGWEVVLTLRVTVEGSNQ